MIERLSPLESLSPSATMSTESNKTKQEEPKGRARLRLPCSGAQQNIETMGFAPAMWSASEMILRLRRDVEVMGLWVKWRQRNCLFSQYSWCLTKEVRKGSSKAAREGSADARSWHYQPADIHCNECSDSLTGYHQPIVDSVNGPTTIPPTLLLGTIS
jgi:hypothetical protein